MSYFYSAKKNVFISEGSPLLSTSDFSDSIKVDDDIFSEFVISPQGDKMRVVGADGLPAWGDVPPVVIDYVSLANQQKETLLYDAKQAISIWQTELLLESISDSDKSTLANWIVYIKAVQAVDTSTASKNVAISFPVKPN
ncbi:tail fiber assembly protein [Ewingella americana]